MSDTKFTPGPWVAMNGRSDIFGPLGGDSGDGWKADDTDGWKVAEVGSYMTLSEGQDTELGEECRQANARLIAAAPELYEALASIENDDGSIPQAIWDMRNAALAKARGES